MRKAVIDTCAMIDMLMATRPRHDQARKLRHEMVRLDVVAHLPYFAIFEIIHALRQEQRLSQGRLMSSDAGGAEGVRVEFVPIDEGFVKRYFDVNLPELRAGDLIFAAFAKGEGFPLITEDVKLSVASRSAGIEVHSIEKYCDALSKVAV